MVGLLTAPASQLVSSAGWADTLKVGGVFSPSGHALGPAHKAYLPYCSSDSWVGDASWTDEGGTWQMRGAANLRVAVESLLDGGMDSAALVLVGGCSAGGRGASRRGERGGRAHASRGLRGHPATSERAGERRGGGCRSPRVACCC